MEKTPLQRAIDACGSPAKLAERLKVTPQAISQWHEKLPPGRALQIAKLAGVPVEKVLEPSQ